MTQPTQGDLSPGAASGVEVPVERHWRRVPNINILPHRRGTPPEILMFRGILLAVLLLAAYLAQDQYRQNAVAAQTASATKGQLQNTQRQIAALQQELEPLRAQITQLQQERDTRKQGHQEILGDRMNWHAGLSALFGAQVPGISFEAVKVDPRGEVTLEGVATEQRAMAELHTRLRGLSPILDLQSVKWESGSATLAFTALFKARR